jgi:hypothetical protein
MIQRGSAEIALTVAVGVVGTASAGAPMIVLAVSEEAARNSQFAAALIGAFIGFGSILAWFARIAWRAMKKLETLDILAAQAQRMEDNQVTVQRYEADRLHDREEAARIFAVAEANRQAAEESGITGLAPLPFVPHS